MAKEADKVGGLPVSRWLDVYANDELIDS